MERISKVSEEDHTGIERPLLSVSVAAYNAEMYLGRCLDSCLGFDGRVEVIVVDDGSSDGTASIADDYSRAYPGIVRVIHKKNGHYGSTVNASLPMARGKFYRLLDSDDWFDREALDKWLAVLAKSDSDAACTASVRVMGKSGKKITMDPWPDVLPGDHDLENLCVNAVPGPGISNLAYRTDFLKRVKLQLLEHCNYVDEELRAIPWCQVRSVRVDHIPVYCVLKERDGQNTSLEGIRRSASDKAKMFFHVMSEVDFKESKERTRAQKMALKVVAENIVAGHYANMLLRVPSRKAKRELLEFDQKLKENFPEIYEMSGESSRALRLLRSSGFLLYGLLSRRSQRKWRY